MTFEVDPRPTAARYLRSGDLVRLDGAFVEIDRLNMCDGTDEPLQLCGGPDYKTSAAIRIHFTDGASVVTHPDCQLMKA